mmetsp:Transcript_39579/g.86443  ORF Transcript_39579/g.86443 Transcript_39579/m.86443 type:complete len:93 (+) Transcript_39579:152-430(+)
MLPNSLQGQNSGIEMGELAFRDFHRDIVQEMLDRRGPSERGKCIRQVAAACALVLIQFWKNNEARDVVRTPESYRGAVTCLAEILDGFPLDA